MTRRAKSRLADVAQAAGVSSATASRALAQPGLVAAGTLARVRASAQALGYRPDAATRALSAIREDRRPQALELPVELVVRRSTGPDWGNSAP
jgi:DNA-binding LacI/PurR family transcriptional regulator